MQTQTYGGDVDKRVRIDNLRPKNMMLEKEVMNQLKKQNQDHLQQKKIIKHYGIQPLAGGNSKKRTPRTQKDPNV